MARSGGGHMRILKMNDPSYNRLHQQNNVKDYA
jgi:hypothetical protein